MAYNPFDSLNNGGTFPISPRRISHDPVQIHIARDPLSMSFVFYTNDSRIPKQAYPISFNYDDRELRMMLESYIHGIIHRGFATKDEIDLKLPNMFALCVERQREAEKIEQYKALQKQKQQEEKKKKEEAEPFEVNMMETLQGWKGWNLTGEFITSPTYHGIWKPDEAFTATCRGKCEVPVSAAHQCGIYAADKQSGAVNYGNIAGTIYGWGRYVRGNDGWRAQFAYPKSFHLKEDQVELIDALKKYHVPIYIQQPVRMYDPEEDGYGHWNAEEDGNSGTDQESATREARSAFEDDEEDD